MKSSQCKIQHLGYAILCLLFSFLLVGTNAFAQSLSQDDQNSIYGDTVWYKASGGTSGSCSTTLEGNDNEQKTWNYFKGKGLTDPQVAGVMGNIEQESSFDPERVQSGGDSTTPPNTPGVGWGIVQWTPGTKAQDAAQEYNINGAIYELATQLDIVWAEMSGTSPTGAQNMLNGLEQISDAAQAASYFNSNFEQGTDPSGVRESNAQKILQQYGGSSGGGSSSGSCIIGLETDCTTVSGDPKILCEAEKYQGIYYRWGGGHQGYSAFIAGCPNPANAPDNQPTGSPPDPTDNGLSGNPSPCATDCTGLVSIALDEAFNQDYIWTVNGTMQGDGAQYWKQIPIEQATAGDIVTTQDHVEIVDHVSGNTVYTFGSHETGTQTGPVTSSTGDWTYGAWRWTGPGSGG